MVLITEKQKKLDEGRKKLVKKVDQMSNHSDDLPDIHTPANNKKRKRKPETDTEDDTDSVYEEMDNLKKKKKMYNRSRVSNGKENMNGPNRSSNNQPILRKRVTKKSKQPTCTVSKPPKDDSSDDGEQGMDRKKVEIEEEYTKAGEGEGEVRSDKLTKKNMAKGKQVEAKVDHNYVRSDGHVRGEKVVLSEKDNIQALKSTNERYIQFSDEEMPTEFSILHKPDTDSDRYSPIIPLTQKVTDKKETTKMPIPTCSSMDTEIAPIRRDMNRMASSTSSTPTNGKLSRKKVAFEDGKKESDVTTITQTTSGKLGSEMENIGHVQPVNMSKPISPLRPHLKLSYDGRPTSDHVIPGNFSMHQAYIRQCENDMARGTFPYIPFLPIENIGTSHTTSEAFTNNNPCINPTNMLPNMTFHSNVVPQTGNILPLYSDVSYPNNVENTNPTMTNPITTSPLTTGQNYIGELGNMSVNNILTTPNTGFTNSLPDSSEPAKTPTIGAGCNNEMLEAVRDIGRTLHDIRQIWGGLSRDLRGKSHFMFSICFIKIL